MKQQRRLFLTTTQRLLQELMFKAARMITHAGQWMLGLGANDPAFTVFERHYRQLNTA